MKDHLTNPQIIEQQPDLIEFFGSLPKNPNEDYERHVSDNMENIADLVISLSVLVNDLAAYIAKNREALQDYHTFLDSIAKGFLDEFCALSGLPTQSIEEKEAFKQEQKMGFYLDSITLLPLEIAQRLPDIANNLNAIHEEMKAIKIKAVARQ